MSSPNDPPREPTLEQKIRMTNSFSSFLHNSSLAMLIIAPVLIALPPRKLDMYTFLLAGGFFASANHITKERTGAGLLYQLPGARLPLVAVEYQERRRLLDEPPSQAQAQMPSIQEQLQRRGIEHRKEEGLEKMAKDIWLGGEKEGWKERRLAEEQKKLDEGEGYGSMIVDQIWEVWNWGEKKAEDLREKDEEVVRERKDEEVVRERKDAKKS